MPKEEWGTKRVCPTTGKRFYDLNRTPVVSPYTGQVVNLDASRVSRVLVSDKADKARTEDEDDLLLEEEIDEAATEADLDDDLLEDDDDDSVSLDEIADMPGSEDEG